MGDLPAGAQGEAAIEVRDENGQPIDLASLPPEVREQLVRESRGAAGGGAPTTIADLAPTKSFTFRDSGAYHTSANVSGWTVVVDRQLSDANTRLANRALTQLERDLDRIAAALPAEAVTALRVVPIWIGMDSGSPRAAEYHWPGAIGANAGKSGAVEISRAREYLEMVAIEQPSMVLHELAHAYHERVLGADYGPIRNAFEAARRSGAYDLVKHVGGGTDRAYAMTDEREYFAELTEAYFGRNDFQPFDRAELKQHDPAGYFMVERAWSGR